MIRHKISVDESAAIRTYLVPLKIRELKPLFPAIRGDSMGVSAIVCRVGTAVEQDIFGLLAMERKPRNDRS
jgi:hypothetical protein